MECQPLGINVTLIVGGYVKSNLVANARPHFHLPENTLYPTYASKIYAGLRAGKGFRSDATVTDVFAERVAKETMKKNPPRYLCFGGRSTWYKVFVWLPRVLILMYLWRTLGK